MKLTGDRRAVPATVASAGTLVAADLTRSVLPGGVWHAATTATMVGIARWAGLGLAELGLGRDRLRAGLRLGGIAFAGIGAAVVSGGLLGLVHDDRADVSASQAALKVLVLIPLGTVLVEEVAFRGVLQGLLDRVTSARGSLLAGSVLFGLWHVHPAATGGGVPTDVPVPVLVTGTFVATTAAGAGFWWLRRRSGSLVAPMLAHLATNSVTFATAWAATR